MEYKYKVWRYSSTSKGSTGVSAFKVSSSGQIKLKLYSKYI